VLQNKTKYDYCAYCAHVNVQTEEGMGGNGKANPKTHQTVAKPSKTRTA
jgi:hypothetical protein